MLSQKSSKPSETEDCELVVRAQEGDQGAFSELVRRYHERVFNTVYALVGDRDDADDVAQEAFLKAYRSLNSFQSKSSFYTWLYRISINTCLDWMKSRNRRGDVSLERGQWQKADDTSRAFRRPEASDGRVHRRELREMLEHSLTALPLEFRVAVVMREIDGLSYEEIGRVMGCSVGTVKSRLFRARTQIRRFLESHYQEWFAV